MALARLSVRRAGVAPLWPWAAALTLLGVCFVGLVWYPVVRIDTIASLNYNEGWNVYRQRIAADGGRLFATLPTLWITDYPSLSFHLVGGLGRLIGSTLLAGRLVSLAGLCVVCVLLAAIVRRLTGGWRGAIYAALCFFLWVAVYMTRRIGIDDPEFLADALAIAGVYAYVRAEPHAEPGGVRWLIASALLFACAVFTKLDIVSLPIGVGLHLVSSRRWRDGFIWVAAGAGFAAVFLFMSFMVDGRYVLTDLLWPRFYRIAHVAYALRYYAIRFGAPVLLVGCAWPLVGDFPGRSLLAHLLLVTLPIALFFGGGDGVAHNVLYPPLMVLATACGAVLIAIERRFSGQSGSGWFVAVLTLVPIAYAVWLTPARMSADIGDWQQLPGLARDAKAMIARLRPIDGKVICEDILVCYQAGKTLGYDPWFVDDQIRVGLIRRDRILASIAAQHYAAIEIGNADDPVYANFHTRFDERFLKTLRAHYRIVFSDPIYQIFVPISGHSYASGPGF